MMLLCQNESYLDQTYKKSLIDTLLFRCFLICSDYALFHLEVENLREISKENSYPSGIIGQSIKYFLNITFLFLLFGDAAAIVLLTVIAPLTSIYRSL